MKKIITIVIISLAIIVSGVWGQEAPQTKSELEGALREKQLELALIQERFKVIQGIEIPAIKGRLDKLSKDEKSEKKAEKEKTK